MTSISIIYFSGSGVTDGVVKLVAAGTETITAVHCHLLRLSPEHIVNGRWRHSETLDTLNASDGIIFGSPTYMGSIASPFKAFMDTTSELWMPQRWKDKLAAGFTTSGSPAGDNLNSLIQMSIFAAQHGMIWIGQVELPGKYASGGSPDDANRLGSFLGLATQLTPGESLELAPPGDHKTAKLFGQRIAELTRIFQNGRVHI
ncbi:flavodoxin family protein [Gloeocapsa sp. BRSZ]